MPMINRRRSSSSSRSRSLSPYNKRRRARSPRRSRSPRKRSRSPRKRSFSPRRSPPRRSPSGRRRSSPGRGPPKRRSLSRRRSLSPVKRRSPSPRRRRSPSPHKNRSPSPHRRRSPTPPKRSPKRRSPSPRHRGQRSRSRHRSPRHRSPARKKSPAPRKRSPPPPRRSPPPPRSKERYDRRTPPRRQYSSHGERRRSAEGRGVPSAAKRHRSSSPRPPQPAHANDPRYATGPGTGGSHEGMVVGTAPLDPLVGKHDVDYRKGAGRGAKEPGTRDSGDAHGYGTPQRRCELGYTGVSTHARFSPLSTAKDFKPKDVISIGIERNILGDEPAVIPAVLRAEDVVIKRRKDEGLQMLHLREEFETREDDVEEKRTIKVVRSSKSPEPRKKKKFEHENFEVRREMLSLSDRWSDKSPSAKTEQVARRQSASLQHGDRDERLVTPRSADRDKRKERARSPVMKLTISDRDERIVSSRDSESSRGAARKDGKKEAGDKDRELPRDPNDLRYNLSRKRGERPIVDAREKIRSRRGEGANRRSESPVDFRKVRRSSVEPLPDFSRRPDKFTFKEWESRPELIPKGNMYYEVSNPLSGNHDSSSSSDSEARDHDYGQDRRGFTMESPGRAGPAGFRHSSKSSPEQRSNGAKGRSNGPEERSKEPKKGNHGWKERSSGTKQHGNGLRKHSNGIGRAGGDASPHWYENGSGKEEGLSSRGSSASSLSPPPKREVRSKLVRAQGGKEKKRSGRGGARSPPQIRDRSRSKSSPRSRDRSRSQSSERSKVFRKRRSDSRSDLRVKEKRLSRSPSEEKLNIRRPRSRSWSRYDHSSRPRNEVRSDGLEAPRNDLCRSRGDDLGSKDVDERQHARPYSPIVWTEERRSSDRGSRERAWQRQDQDYRQERRGVAASHQYYRESYDEERRHDKRERAHFRMRSPAQHDNRDDYDYWSRGRGRMRGRGRGFFRGRGRGRGFSSSEPPWLHDKYQDEEPSSTTK